MTKVNIFGHHFHNAEDVQAAVTESFPLIKNDAFELLWRLLCPLVQWYNYKLLYSEWGFYNKQVLPQNHNTSQHSRKLWTITLPK